MFDRIKHTILHAMGRCAAHIDPRPEPTTEEIGGELRRRLRLAYALGAINQTRSDIGLELLPIDEGIEAIAQGRF